MRQSVCQWTTVSMKMWKCSDVICEWCCEWKWSRIRQFKQQDANVPLLCSPICPWFVDRMRAKALHGIQASWTVSSPPNPWCKSFSIGSVGLAQYSLWFQRFFCWKEYQIENQIETNGSQLTLTSIWSDHRLESNQSKWYVNTSIRHLVIAVSHSDRQSVWRMTSEDLKIKSKALFRHQLFLSPSISEMRSHTLQIRFEVLTVFVIVQFRKQNPRSNYEFDNVLQILGGFVQ